ncbi:Peptide methionine sulfoxide reductase msrA [Emticicia oligotrophica DSM 17448]|uniref:Peptide methionine sulfoxide reductase MsrA n=1 Tax=Emticicia oligotrophica (strain DSM 17448 / CIP 109782 / MTCC 6937 / GPTSA100-15) TaxID=929562 RepID=A0ABN4API1_EMTOG|nr:peptide-methionine (S)-S-oxide reductase MsrA [Emticicia oligotrophica]AFK03079.1 Peptide methionine sulfoxide reductase msrA [Emticicia oligotrophica DSM 17448]
MKNVFSLLGLILSVISVNAQTDKNKVNKMNQENVNSVNSTFPKVGVATFGAGCFWCVEAMFQKLNGVEKVESGYMGGTVKNPTYKQVCTGETGHAEVIHITYNPNIVSYEELLEVFWKVHDPTTLNRQGADVGTQYRSVVFFHDENQQTIAEKLKKDLDSSGAFDAPIVTSIEPAGVFYIAEDYHQDYYNLLGGTNSYCQMVVKPKIEKFKKVFSDKIKH